MFDLIKKVTPRALRVGIVTWNLLCRFFLTSFQLGKHANTSAAWPRRLCFGQQGEHFTKSEGQFWEKTLWRWCVQHCRQCGPQTHSLWRSLSHWCVKRGCPLNICLHFTFFCWKSKERKRWKPHLQRSLQKNFFLICSLLIFFTPLFTAFSTCYTTGPWRGQRTGRRYWATFINNHTHQNT